jgi:hypothetical protein
MSKPLVSLRRHQLILVNKVVNEKEQLQKGMEEEEEKNQNNVPLSPVRKVELKAGHSWIENGLTTVLKCAISSYIS